MSDIVYRRGVIPTTTPLTSHSRIGSCDFPVDLPVASSSQTSDSSDISTYRPGKETKYYEILFVKSLSVIFINAIYVFEEAYDHYVDLVNRPEVKMPANDKTCLCHMSQYINDTMSVS